MRLMPSLFLTALLVSCSLQAKLTLVPDGSATVDASISLAAPTKAAWATLRDLDPTLPVDPLDPDLLRRGLGTQSQVAATADGTTVAFPVAHPKKLFPEWKTDSDSWDLTLDRGTIRRLTALTSWSDSPALDSLLPAPGTKITEAEYRDLLVYLLGPGTPEAAARVLVDASTVRLTIVAPRPLRTAEGAVSLEGNTAVYRWPLVRVLTLETPIRLHLSF